MVVVAGFAAVLPGLILAPPALGQKKAIVDPQQPQQPKQPEYKPGSRFSAFKLIDNKEYQNSIDQAIIATEDNDWTAACIYLQAILDSQEDFFADVETRNKETGETKMSSISVKLMANNLLAKMPPNGLNTYELEIRRYCQAEARRGQEQRQPGNAGHRRQPLSPHQGRLGSE